MCNKENMDDPKNFTLTGPKSVKNFDAVGSFSGNTSLPGKSGIAAEGYFVRTTGSVWKVSDRQKQIFQASRIEQLAKAGAGPLTRGQAYNPA